MSAKQSSGRKLHRCLAFVCCLIGLASAGCPPIADNVPDQVAEVTFAPLSSLFADAIDVTLACATADASIRYTTDGSTPSQSNGTLIASGGSVNITTTTTLKAIAYKDSMTDSAITQATYTKMGQVAQPTFNPAGGSFANSVDVEISCATSGATIRYTTDGSTPSQSNGTVIASGDSATISSTTTLKAIAYRSAMADSAVTEATYTKLDQVAQPTFNPTASSFAASVDVEISCATAGATIRYTTDGSAPTQSNGTVIASGASVNISSTTTLKAIAYQSGLIDSAVTEATYTKMDQVAQPIFNPAASSFVTSVDVEISSATSGATIRYTTDGSAPTQSNGTVIASGDSVNISSTTTLKAIAYQSGLTDSAVTEATYTKMTPVLQPTFNQNSDVYLNSVSVQITCATAGATIRYTTDGTDPSQTNGTIIASGDSINLTSTTTLAAIAYKSDMLDSTVNRATYVVFEMVLVSAGTFDMGDITGNGENNELPVHTVTLSQSFYIGKFEVTQIQWLAIMGSNPSNFTGDSSRPVEQVSWNDCQAFITALSTRLGETFRLPTEAEWEYACRAGTSTDYSFGNDPAQLGDYAWYLDNSGFVTHPVGQKLPNAWGLYDMHGSVWELCNDWYDVYAAGPATDPTGPGSGTQRVVRGASWFDYAETTRSAYRVGLDPAMSNGNIGLRVAMDVP